ncbi:MAG: dihydrofolate reductase family protein [Streptosporangiaceae bacterium]
MLIKSRMGISADGLVSTPEGVPAIAVAAGFESGGSHGYPEFIEGCDAVVMGRTTFLPALGAPQWAGLQVYVLTSSPLPAGTPEHMVTARLGPAHLLDQLRSRPSGGDVHLVGGPQTIRAFRELGALDRLDLVVLPMLLGEGLPLSPQGAPSVPLTLLRADRTFPSGSAELVYTPA